jgi:hypothetical protein
MVVQEAVKLYVVQEKAEVVALEVGLEWVSMLRV